MDVGETLSAVFVLEKRMAMLLQIFHVERPPAAFAPIAFIGMKIANAADWECQRPPLMAWHLRDIVLLLCRQG